MKKLYIGNCSFGLDEEALRTFIEAAGVQVSSVQIIQDKYTGRSRGFGFAELSDNADVNAAIDALNGKELDGRPLTVNEAREQKPRFGGGGGNFDNSYGGGGGGGRKFKGNGRKPQRW